MTAHPRSLSASIDPVKLDRLAEAAVKVGLRLRAGQDLLITAPVAALPLVRRIAEHAYKAGPASSPRSSPTRSHAFALSLRRGGKFDRAAGWLYDGIAKAFAADTARLAIVGDNPMLLSGEDPAKVARANKANSFAYQPALEKIASFDINWNIVAYPGASWARRCFPAKKRTLRWPNSPTRFSPLRASTMTIPSRHGRRTTPNSPAQRMAERSEVPGPALFRTGADLTIGLADGHEWQGGASTAKNGIICNPNIPTEEVFTTPHARRVEGHIVSTKPLSYQGTLIDGIAVRFEGGRIVDAKAARGEAVLKKVLDTDEGARRLGEVALVPHSSPISKSGLLFFNTLFDENAACHIALGQCYSKCFLDGAKLTPEQSRRRAATRA